MQLVKTLRSFSRYVPKDLPPYTIVTDLRPKYTARAAYNLKDIENVLDVKTKPKTFLDYFGYLSVRLFVLPFEDLKKTFSRPREEMERNLFRRLVLFESLAGTPGMVAANFLHFRSMRKQFNYSERINTLLEEAENEKVHLFTFLSIYEPSLKNRIEAHVYHYLYRIYFSCLYRLSQKAAHKVIGYIEEEAVHSYTKVLHAIDSEVLTHWKKVPAPQIAREYWKLPEGANMRDVILVIRADEAFHRETNHYFSDLKKGEGNQFEKLAKLGASRADGESPVSGAKHQA